MHLVEMAKVAWNMMAQEDGTSSRRSEEQLQTDLNAYLASSQDILGIFGPEGDEEGGPLEEIRTLRELSGIK